MKNIVKKALDCLATLLLLILLTTPVFAGTDGGSSKQVKKTFSNEPKYIYMFSEAEGKYIPYENPNYPRANISMNQPKKSLQINQGMATGSPELGITMSRQSYNVFTTTSTSSTIVGTIGSTKSREIVRVNSETTVGSGKWYNITYKTSTGTKTGYIKAVDIDIPSRIYSYSKVMTSGTWTQDYGYNSHTGVDIGGGSQSVYAFTSGTAYYRYDKFQHPDDNNYYLISYGNYVQQSPSLGTTTYAHLGSFANGFSASTLPSKQISKSHDIYKNNTSRYTLVNVGNVNVSAGALLGSSGSTGNSDGTHLHFEISGKDPFKYILFPDYGYVN